MLGAGRKPRSEAIRDLRGTGGRAPRDKEVASTGDIEIPAEILKSKKLLKRWEYFAPDRIKLGVLKHGDETLFATLISLIDEFYEDMRGFPCNKIIQMRTLHEIFEMSPTGRARSAMARGKAMKENETNSEEGYFEDRQQKSA